MVGAATGRERLAEASRSLPVAAPKSRSRPFAYFTRSSSFSPPSPRLYVGKWR